MTWEVVTGFGYEDITGSTPLAHAVAKVATTVPGWRITGVRWVATKHDKAWIAYIERAEPYHFIAPDAMGSPAAAINEAVRRAEQSNRPTPAPSAQEHDGGET